MEKRWTNKCCGFYKCIIMDLLMPQMDGHEATALIREKEKKFNFNVCSIIA